MSSHDGNPLAPARGCLVALAIMAVVYGVAATVVIAILVLT